MRCLAANDLTTNDVFNVLRNGKIRRKHKIDKESGEAIYRMETARNVVVFKFKLFQLGQKTMTGVKLITCWRK